MIPQKICRWWQYLQIQVWLVNTHQAINCLEWPLQGGGLRYRLLQYAFMQQLVHNSQMKSSMQLKSGQMRYLHQLPYSMGCHKPHSRSPYAVVGVQTHHKASCGASDVVHSSMKLVLNMKKCHAPNNLSPKHKRSGVKHVMLLVNLACWC